ncbi:MAG: hypothetical protein IJT21_09400 [Synergistaceae bacterium]|nr:hypothetical protein [Synergistaceae bacterium]
MRINEYMMNQSVMFPAQNNLQNTRDSQPRENPEFDAFLQAAAINSRTYDSSGTIPGGVPPVPPSSESGFKQDFTASSEFMSRVSNAFRANIDSIQAAMSGLGLTVEDLSDSENLTLLGETLNEGAEALGLPQIENVDNEVAKLLGKDDKKPEMPDLPGGSHNEPVKKENESGETEVNTKIVNSGRVSYLETEKTSANGVTTTTRTMIGSMGKTSTMRGGVSAFGGMPTTKTFSGTSGISDLNRINFIKAK